MENYSLAQEVGRGKYSVVYKGRRKQSTEYLAIKSVDKDRRARVINEVSFNLYIIKNKFYFIL